MELQAWWYRSLPDSLQVMGSLSPLPDTRPMILADVHIMCSILIVTLKNMTAIIIVFKHTITKPWCTLNWFCL